MESKQLDDSKLAMTHQAQYNSLSFAILLILPKTILDLTKELSVASKYFLIQLKMISRYRS